MSDDQPDLRNIELLIADLEAQKRAMQSLRSAHAQPTDHHYFFNSLAEYIGKTPEGEAYRICNLAASLTYAA